MRIEEGRLIIAANPQKQQTDITQVKQICPG
jgi:hypothetical protein